MVNKAGNERSGHIFDRDTGHSYGQIQEQLETGRLVDWTDKPILAARPGHAGDLGATARLPPSHIRDKETGAH